MDSRNPLCTQEAEIKSKCFTIIQHVIQMMIYSTGKPEGPDPAAQLPGRPAVCSGSLHGVTAFRFYRFRFRLRAIDQLHFAPGKSGNALRGSFGKFLSETSDSATYTNLFQPGNTRKWTPAGLADWPRPFLFRAAHLDGLTISPKCEFYFDLHCFQPQEPPLAAFRKAFARIAIEGIATGRGRAAIEGIEQLDLEDGAELIGNQPGPACAIVLDRAPHPVRSVRLQFVTPTELKHEGSVADRPEFPVLFGRLRDRISTLRALYGEGPIELDFRGMGARANAVGLTYCDLQWRHVQRKSSRTGESHPLGGFTGVAEYAGPLEEFMPWLYAARWVGVGRQTVWGKGDVRVLSAS